MNAVALQRTEAEDEAWFIRWPDRDFRLRRSSPAEFDDALPENVYAFVIVHRQEIGQHYAHKYFVAWSWFRTDRSDAEIRDILFAIRDDKTAILKANIT